MDTTRKKTNTESAEVPQRNTEKTDSVRKKTNTEGAEVPQRNTERTDSVLLCDGSVNSVFAFFKDGDGLGV
jgi:hypothetical protein